MSSSMQGHPDEQGGEVDPTSHDGLHFAGLDWAGKVLRQVQFTNCTFEHCGLAKASFLDCRMQDCLFKACDLSLAKVGGTLLVRVGFEECKLVGVDWTAARQSIFHVRLAGCNLSHAAFAGMKLRGLEMVRCLAKDLDLREADLAEAIFHDTDFAGCEFFHTNLTRADLSRAKNYSIDPNTNTIRKTAFSLPEAASLLAGYDIVWR